MKQSIRIYVPVMLVALLLGWMIFLGWIIRNLL
jgi:hypothetical protein